jgi:hypothetical protein
MAAHALVPAWWAYRQIPALRNAVRKIIWFRATKVAERFGWFNVQTL